LWFDALHIGYFVNRFDRGNVESMSIATSGAKACSEGIGKAKISLASAQ
jgi:hypothetical protein